MFLVAGVAVVQTAFLMLCGASRRPRPFREVSMACVRLGSLRRSGGFRALSHRPWDVC